MKTYRKMPAVVAAFAALSLSAMAAPVYYTIFHALEEDTMAVFRDGGSGSLSISDDGGQSYRDVSRFSFDRYGRAVARVYALNTVPADTPVKLKAQFNEGAKGQPLPTVVETTAGEFLDELSPYSRWSWIAYAPIYVAYNELPDIVDTAIAAGSFDVLVAAVQAAGLEEALRGEGPFTVFAPTDDAFAELLGALGVTAEQLLADPGLGDILLYHVAGAALKGEAVIAETHIETLLGKDIDVAVVNGELFINESKVVVADIEASNGIIHVIDQVLLPPTLPTIPETAVDAGIFNTLVAALQATGLDVALSGEGPFTVFAPTDDAFAALGIPAEDLLANPDLADILLYHVVDGRLKASDVAAMERLETLLGEQVKVNVTDDGVFINNAKVVVADVKAENGIIHVIDAVLIPEEMPGIVDIAVGAGNFNELVAALQATGLVDVLQGDGPFTVFAPTDEAFAALPYWVKSFLTRYPQYLKQVLLYHVVPGDLQAAEVIEAGKLKTASGYSLYPKVKDGKVYVDGAEIIATDIEASNGTVHVIDKVMIPWF